MVSGCNNKWGLTLQQTPLKQLLCQTRTEKQLLTVQPKKLTLFWSYFMLRTARVVFHKTAGHSKSCLLPSSEVGGLQPVACNSLSNSSLWLHYTLQHFESFTFDERLKSALTLQQMHCICCDCFPFKATLCFTCRMFLTGSGGCRKFRVSSNIDLIQLWGALCRLNTKKIESQTILDYLLHCFLKTYCK